MKKIFLLILLLTPTVKASLLELSIQGSMDEVCWTNVVTHPSTLRLTNGMELFWSPVPLILSQSGSNASFEMKLFSGTNLQSITNQLFVGDFAVSVPDGGFTYYRTHLELIP